MRLMNLYHFGMTIISLIAAPFFLLSERGRFRLLERFGFWKIEKGSYVWFHGASLGEIAGLEPVVKTALEANSKLNILVTSSSSTGVEKAETFAKNVSLIPFDSMFFYSLALKNIDISTLVISETELWPGLLDYAAENKIPVQIINARISDYTIKQYSKLRWLLKPLLSKLKKVIAVNEKCSQRFASLGVPLNVINIVPNTKYDKSKSSLIADANFNVFENNLPTLTLGCLRPGEEKICFPAIKKALETLDLNIIIAPRHKEKFEFFARELFKYQIPFINWTDLENSTAPQGKVLLLNTYGKLGDAYSISDAAFIGATLVDIGGHNPLEAAAYGCYLLVGPYVSTIEELISRLESDGACKTICNTDEAYQTIKFIIESNAEVKKLGALGKKFYEEHQGVSKLVVKELGLVENA